MFNIDINAVCSEIHRYVLFLQRSKQNARTASCVQNVKCCMLKLSARIEITELERLKNSHHDISIMEHKMG